MKSTKFFGKWLIVILLMAIGIGTFGALYLADKGRTDQDQAEGSKAAPKSYLTNQRKHDIDMDALSAVMGEYKSEEGTWHLSIKDEYKENGPYLSVYDDKTGEPGFEGRIMYLKDDLVIVEIDEDQYKSMPDGWQPEGEGKYAILDCVSTDGGVNLGYRGKNLLFSAV